MTNEELVQAHDSCRHNKEALAGSEAAGCFYCLGVIHPSKVVEYCDKGGTTAVCPLCLVDALLPSSSGLPVTDPKFLSQMHRYWFAPRQEM